MESKQLEEFRALLLAKRTELAERLSDLRSERIKHQARDASDSVTTYSDHPADIGSDLYERERIAESVSQLNKQIMEFDDAIARLEQGNYGVCEKCGAEISVERLLNRPSTRYCMDCQTKLERAGKDKR